MRRRHKEKIDIYTSIKMKTIQLLLPVLCICFILGSCGEKPQVNTKAPEGEDKMTVRKSDTAAMEECAYYPDLYENNEISVEDWNAVSRGAPIQLVDDSLFDSIGKVASTKPDFPPGVGIGNGAPWTTCQISSSKNEREQWLVDVYPGNEFFSLSKIFIDEMKPGSYCVEFFGSYLNTETWRELRFAILKK